MPVVVLKYVEKNIFYPASVPLVPLCFEQMHIEDVEQNSGFPPAGEGGGGGKTALCTSIGCWTASGISFNYPSVDMVTSNAHLKYQRSGALGETRTSEGGQRP